MATTIAGSWSIAMAGERVREMRWVQFYELADLVLGHETTLVWIIIFSFFFVHPIEGGELWESSMVSFLKRYSSILGCVIEVGWNIMFKRSFFSPLGMQVIHIFKVLEVSIFAFQNLFNQWISESFSSNYFHASQTIFMQASFVSLAYFVFFFSV